MSSAPVSRIIAPQSLWRTVQTPTLRRTTQIRHVSELKNIPRDADSRITRLKDIPTRNKPETIIRNPLDDVTIHRVETARQAYRAKRRNRLAAGAAASMIAPMLLVPMFWDEDGSKTDEAGSTGHQIKSNGALRADSSNEATQAFQGKPIVIAPGDKILATTDPSNPSLSSPDDIELVPTGTSYIPYFPKTIHLATKTTSTGPEAISSKAEYTLLGLGIRKVSFLRVQVYVVGLYVKTSDMSTLQNHLINTVNPTASALIPGEKEELRAALLDADRSTQIWENILSQRGPSGVETAFRVVPVRGTDFKHLQDGWMRGIASRTDETRRKQQALLQQQAQEEKRISLPQPVDPSEFADDSFGESMKAFKALFTGKGKAPKGSILTLTRDKEGALGALYVKDGERKGAEGRVVDLGEVRDERVSRLVWMLYLGGKNVSSEEARRSVVDGCIGIVERPVGTVENRVV